MSSIIIKNLPKCLNEEDVAGLFECAGDIQSCFVGSDVDGDSLGFAIILFDDSDSALSSIMRMNGRRVENNKIEVEYLDTKLEAELQKPDHKFTNLYFKHIRDYVTEDDIEKLFSTFGEIKSIHIELDEQSNSKKFGFVSFETHSAALSALISMQDADKLPEIENGQKLYLAPAQSKEERNIAKNKKNREWNLYVKNLPNHADDDFLIDLFKPFGVIESAKVMPDPTGRSRKFGFVCYDSQESANKALLQMNSSPVGEGDETLYVSIAEKKEERKAKMKSKANVQQQENLDNQLLYVKNLASYIDDNYLGTIFKRYGPLRSAKVVVDEHGMSREFGFVCFETSEDAEKALQMNGRFVLNKPLYVAFAERKEDRQAKLANLKNNRGSKKRLK